MGKVFRFLLKPFAGVSSRFWGGFLLASALAMSLEIVSEKVVETDQHPSLSQSIFNVSGLYQHIVRAGRTPIPRYTEIVSIDPVNEKHAIPSSHNVCAQREFLARLVERIATAAPDVIVIDKDFLPDECDQSSSELLIATFRRVTQTVPIVVGRTLKDSVKPGNFSEAPSFHFELPEGSLFYQGIASLDPDTRRLPLAWPSGGFSWPPDLAPPSGESWPSRESPAWWESIALKTARAHDPNFVAVRPRLQRLLVGESPFISFLDGFDVHPSLEVLCDAPIQVADSWRSCVKQNESPEQLVNSARRLNILRSKIVIIGEVSDEDVHQTVRGSTPGFLLQANFIEALLDDRYYAPVCWADYILGFILFVFIELILESEQPLWRAILEIGVLIFAAVACLFALVLAFQVYVNPFPVSAVAIVVKLGGLLSEKIQRKHTRAKLPPIHVGRSIAYFAASILLIGAWTVFCPGPRHIEGRALTVGNANTPSRPIVRTLPAQLPLSVEK
jgi:CHASE2 domain-containing sensor protein